MRTRIFSVLIAAAALLLGGSAAQAAEEIELSWDGTTWAQALQGELFETDLRWVPGDTRTRAFHVRNSGPTAAEVGLAVTSPEGAAFDPELFDDLLVEARLDDGAWVELSEPGLERLLSTSDLPAGASARIDIRAAFDPASTNQTMNRVVALGLRLRLSEGASVIQPTVPDTGGATEDGDLEGTVVEDDALGPGGAEDAPQRGDATGGLLPDTGAPAIAWLLFLSAALVGGGTALLRSKGHRHDSHAR